MLLGVLVNAMYLVGPGQQRWGVKREWKMGGIWEENERKSGDEITRANSRRETGQRQMTHVEMGFAAHSGSQHCRPQSPVLDPSASTPRKSRVDKDRLLRDRLKTDWGRRFRRSGTG